MGSLGRVAVRPGCVKTAHAPKGDHPIALAKLKESASSDGSDPGECMIVRRFRILIIISAGALLGGLGYIALGPHEPTHQGKSVTFWIQSLTNNPPGREEAQDA